MWNGSGGWGATRRMVVIAGVLAVGGCASTGATVGSGVGERMLDAPPYVAGGQSTAGLRLVHLPIHFQAGSSQPEIFDPSTVPGSPVARLLAEMNAYLDEGVGSAAVTPPARGTAPDVQFGCEQLTSDECIDRFEDSRGHGGRWMRLAVGRPSGAWIGGLAGALAEADADAVIVLTVEVGQYWVQQRNLLGAKEVRLGRDHTQPVPWPTALDQPVQVLQLTGAIVGADGRARRIAAEGLLARRTPLVLSGLGIQRLISDEDVERLRTARRDDLPGRPLVWEAAVGSILRELTM
jgi:hypothetical protein